MPGQNHRHIHCFAREEQRGLAKESNSLMGCSESQTQVSDTCIDLLKAPSVPVFLEFKQPGRQELETGGEGHLPKPACHTWHVEIHGEGQVRWCQVHDQGIQSRRAVTGNGSGREGYMSKRGMG